MLWPFLSTIFNISCVKPMTLSMVSIGNSVTIFQTLPVPIPDEERKLTVVFIFTLLCDTSKGFMKALNSS